jgi:hypothetical protein
LEALSRSYGAQVLRHAGPAGWAALAVPKGLDAWRFTQMLRRDSRARDATRDGLTRGVGQPIRATPRPGRARWHVTASNAPDKGDARGVVVALLDTGVAYEDRAEEGRTWRRAPALAGVRFVAPRDFINGDDHPNDDHQHGTHLASLVAAGGAYPGLAPGVTLMPIKVLDRDNVGTELALLDGIAHAVAEGADIINLSLSFGRDYVPSRALTEALEAAARADVVLVGAAGNDGGDYVSQPAANPNVIAVGANRPDGPNSYGPAPYSNASPRVDLMAPGGSVDKDRDGDGLLDGVLGETIALQEPTRTGYWLYAGTSQATALVTSTAARLLAAGHPPHTVRTVLQRSARPESYIRTPWLDGRGPGRLDVMRALDTPPDTGADPGTPPGVALLAWLAPTDDGARRPMARLLVVDGRRTPVPGVQVVGSFSGPSSLPYTCITDESGACFAEGPATQGDATWVISADAVVTGGVAARPRQAFFVNDGLQALVGVLEHAESTARAAPAWRWREGDHPLLGPIAPSLLVADFSTSTPTSPQVLVVTPGGLGQAEVLESGRLVVGGADATSAHLEVEPRPQLACSVSPTAYEALHFAGAGVTLLLLDATGLGDTSMRLDAPQVLGGLPRPGEVQAAPVVPSLGAQACDEPRFEESPVGAVLERGGWTAEGGEPVVASLAALARPPVPPALVRRP